MSVVATWLCEPMAEDVERSIARLREAQDVQYVAVMPDVHLSEHFCIGTVVATEQLLYPDAVGGDIGCGMSAIRLELEADWLSREEHAGRLLGALYQRVPGLGHSRHTARDALPQHLLDWELSTPRLEKMKAREGRIQLATLGRGNHFLEFQADEEGMLWIMVHSGSRAMGQAIRHTHLQHASTNDQGHAFLDAQQPEGQAYLNDMSWALEYAGASRLGMLAAAATCVHELSDAEVEPGSLVQSHHNHVVQEEHFGQRWWVHRKGANAAQQGVPGIIPGSMGTASYLVEGKGHPEALCSSSHGAGRAMSRKLAFERLSVKALERQMKGVWFDRRKSRKLVDEAPGAYKDIRQVMRAQRELVRITRRLSPLLSYKAA